MTCAADRCSLGCSSMPASEGSGNPLENQHVKAVTAEVEAALGKRGRVLLRKSGAAADARDGGGQA